MSERKVTVIPATICNDLTNTSSKQPKRRVAAYARVSTDLDEQLSSYEMQVRYYTEFIKGHSDWKFVKVYSDEGISGTSTKNRVGFQTMVRDALAGGIDLIITKSISRFARNTVDSLTTIRKLKDNGIEVFFEKENIWTFDSKGELLITIMSSIAQEESRSISENVAWGWRHRFAEGRVQFAKMLGYRIKGGRPVVIEAEAEAVRLIFSSYASGMSCGLIAKELERRGFRNTKGEVKWSNSSIRFILQNIKYTGNAILQKTYTADYLTKKRVVNNGELPKYYVEDSHPAIISQELFDAVQARMRKGRNAGSSRCGYAFSCIVHCGKCGRLLSPVMTHKGTRYEKLVWACSGRQGARCDCDRISDVDLKTIALKALNRIAPKAEDISIAIRCMVEESYDPSIIDDEIRHIEADLADLAQRMSAKVDSIRHHSAQVAEFQSDYRKLEDEYALAMEALSEKRDSRDRLMGERGRLLEYANSLSRMPKLLSEFSQGLFRALVENVTVHSRSRVIFTFFDGQKVTEGL